MNCPECGLWVGDGGRCYGCGWLDGPDGLEIVDAWWYTLAVWLDGVVDVLLGWLR